MICRKCGAPIPDGRNACPYCGTSWTAVSRKNDPAEETTFAGTDTEEFFTREEEATEFAPARNAVLPPEEETDFAPAVPIRPHVSRPGESSPVPASKPERRKKQGAKKTTEKKQAQKKQGPNQALRLVLVAVLAVLIVLLILR